MSEGVGGSVGADLAAIEARLAKATPGTWRVIKPGKVAIIVHGDGMDDRICNMAEGMLSEVSMPNEAADAEFIAHAPDDVRQLLDEVSRLGQQLKAETEALGHASMQFVRAAAERDAALALVGQLQGKLDAAERDKAVCNGLCLTAADVGVPVQGNPIAHAHLSCSLHGDPAELGRRADRLLDEVRDERDAARRQLDAVRAVIEDERLVLTRGNAAWFLNLLDRALAAAVLSDREGKPNE